MLFQREREKRMQARVPITTTSSPFVIVSEAVDLCLKVTHCSVRELITHCRSVTLHHRLEGQTDAAAQIRTGKRQRCLVIMRQARWKTSKMISIYLIASSSTARSRFQFIFFLFFWVFFGTFNGKIRPGFSTTK